MEDIRLISLCGENSKFNLGFSYGSRVIKRPGCCFFTLAAPLLDDLIRKIPHRILIPVCITLLAVFGADEVYSNQHPNTGKGITDYTGAWIEEEKVRT